MNIGWCLTMKYEEYYITNNDGKSNCVIRSFCKMFNESYKDVYDELCRIQKELKCENFNDIEVFESYMNNHNVNYTDYGKDIKVKDLKLDNGSYIVFCWDKDEFYHMLPIIDNVVYDKDDRSLELYTISLYKQMELVKKIK